ncbi:MAG TPA: hypothetical protein DCW68_02615 [Rhodospirillaceae bacterium]|nr:MAG: hypothetical protein A2018_05590 [Alphaproteobacteria bacterium GWF2_58_20]HAU28987.1 hypothetical protein [Rhodospirillaceae bacterium]
MNALFAGMPNVFAAALGEDVLLLPQGGEARTVRGVFRAPYEGIGVGGEVDVAGLGIRCACPSADVAGTRQGDLLERAGASYRITGIEPDGQGMTTFRLEEA